MQELDRQQFFSRDDSDSGAPIEYSPPKELLRTVVWTEASPYHQNEDTHLILPQASLVGIFDGAGAETAGQVASREAAQAFRDFIGEATEPIDMKSAFRHAQQHLIEAAGRNRSLQGMTTTATVAQVIGSEDAPVVQFGHVGDSRLFVITRQGLVQLTRDDNIIEYRRRFGEIDDAEALELNRLLDEATFPKEVAKAGRYWGERRVLYNALRAGGDIHEPQFGEYPIQPTDSGLLLTTDGIHDNIPFTEMSLLSQEQDLFSLPEYLGKLATEISRDKGFRSKPDDTTALVVAW